MIDYKEIALVAIDMQNGFINPNSALCVQGAAATIPACARALNFAREQGMAIFHTIREYAEDGSDVEAVRHRTWLAGGKPISKACEDPSSLDIANELAPQPDDFVILKPRFSALFHTKLDLILQRLRIRTLVLIGTTTPNCVRSTCYDALSFDYNVVVIEDCTSSRTPTVQAANIEDMAFVGAHIMTCEQFCTGQLHQMFDHVGSASAAAREACTQKYAAAHHLQTQRS